MDDIIGFSDIALRKIRAALDLGWEIRDITEDQVVLVRGSESGYKIVDEFGRFVNMPLEPVIRDL